MTMSEVSTKETLSDSTKDSSKSKDKKERTRPLTKVIIRRLPPTMSEETFLEQISPIPDHDYFYFVDADRTLGIHAFCRAYINFTNSEDIFIFKEKFDNYIFVDAKGNEFPAVVEYAPYQGVPKRKSRKNDPKCGTIDSDQLYIEFLESLKVDENDSTKQDKTEFSYQIKDDKKITTTPLLEYLAARKYEKQRARAERKEERRKKDLERKKLRDEDRRKRKLEVTRNKPNAIIEENSDDASSLKEGDLEKVKPFKSQESSSNKVGVSNDKDESVKTGDKSFKEPLKVKSKSFRDRRADEALRRTYDVDKRPESKYKYRDEKRSNDTDSKFRKPDYKTNTSRDRKREEERKYGSYKSDVKDTKKYETREFRNDSMKSDRKSEIKKYSEARKEREARRNESKKLTIKNDTSDIKTVTKASHIDITPTESVNEFTSTDLADDGKIAEIDKLAENLQEKVSILEETDLNKDNAMEIMQNYDVEICNSIETSDKVETETVVEQNQTISENADNSVADTCEKVSNSTSSNDVNENKAQTENKKCNNDKRHYEDRKDPRTERRIRNKDRPSMAIYQPGKARLAQNKEKASSTPTTDTDPITDQKSKIDN